MEQTQITPGSVPHNDWQLSNVQSWGTDRISIALFRVCKHTRHEGSVLPISLFNFWIVCQQLCLCFRFWILIKFRNNANQSDVAGKHRYNGSSKETGMVLFIVCVMIIFNPKQYHGLSVNDLQNYQILILKEISAVLGHGCLLMFYICHIFPGRAIVLSICCFWYLSSHFKMTL